MIILQAVVPLLSIIASTVVSVVALRNNKKNMITQSIIENQKNVYLKVFNLMRALQTNVELYCEKDFIEELGNVVDELYLFGDDKIIVEFQEFAMIVIACNSNYENAMKQQDAKYFLGAGTKEDGTYFENIKEYDEEFYSTEIKIRKEYAPDKKEMQKKYYDVRSLMRMSFELKRKRILR